MTNPLPTGKGYVLAKAEDAAEHVHAEDVVEVEGRGGRGVVRLREHVAAAALERGRHGRFSFCGLGASGSGAAGFGAAESGGAGSSGGSPARVMLSGWR